MITQRERQEAIQHAWALCQKKIPLLDHEIDNIEVADFGLSEFKTSGLAILTLAVTQDVGIKLIALYPWQICPEHRHPPLGDYPGKEETFRGLWGQAWGYVPGEPTPDPQARASQALLYVVARGQPRSGTPAHLGAQRVALVPGRAGRSGDPVHFLSADRLPGRFSGPRCPAQDSYRG